jgi:hypothetical protein
VSHNVPTINSPLNVAKIAFEADITGVLHITST